MGAAAVGASVTDGRRRQRSSRVRSASSAAHSTRSTSATWRSPRRRAEALGLERVLFIPAGDRRKAGRRVAPPQDRLAMVELAIAGQPAVRPRAGSSLIGRALRTPRTPSPSSPAVRAAGRRQPFLILSAERSPGLPTWHEPRRVLSLARLVVVPRDGMRTLAAAGLVPDLPDAATEAIFLDGPRLAPLREHVAGQSGGRTIVALSRPGCGPRPYRGPCTLSSLMEEPLNVTEPSMSTESATAHRADGMPVRATPPRRLSDHRSTSRGESWNSPRTRRQPTSSCLT